MATPSDGPPARRGASPPDGTLTIVGLISGVVAVVAAYWAMDIVVAFAATAGGVWGVVAVVLILGLVVGVFIAAALRAATSGARRIGHDDRADEDAHDTEDEIKELLREGHIRGEFEKQERDLIESVFRFTDTEVRQVMVPRPNIVAVDVEADRDMVLKVTDENKFSRYPVYRGSLNDLIGFLYYKDLVPVVEGKDPFDMRSLMRPPFFVPETMRLGTLLRELQRRHLGMAVVVNEHGNVEGLVTLEDILEEIVGEIHDEYDVEERPVEPLRDGSWLVDGSVVIDDLPPQLARLIPHGEGYETVAGYALASLQRLPRSGETWDQDMVRFTVVEMDGRRISRLRVQAVPGAPPEETASEP